MSIRFPHFLELLEAYHMTYYDAINKISTDLVDDYINISQ